MEPNVVSECLPKGSEVATETLTALASDSEGQQNSCINSTRPRPTVPSVRGAPPWRLIGVDLLSGSRQT
ncbi:hypothetical protein KIL84_004796, partial [Mauremys mutica]